MPASTDRALNFLSAIIRPIVALALRRGVFLADFEELVRQAYVEQVADDLKSSGNTINTSRVSVATGLNRRDVARILSGQSKSNSQPGLLHKVVGQWRADRRFCSKADKPKLLTFRGEESQFVELVKSVSSDLNPYTVLFEFERLKIVKKAGEYLKLDAEVFMTPEDFKFAAELLASDLHDLIRTVEENTTSSLPRSATDPSPHHHIKTQYDNVVISALPEIRNWFLIKGAKLHEEARKFLSKFDKDLNPKLKSEEGGGRVAIGSFSFIEKVSKEDKK